MQWTKWINLILGILVIILPFVAGMGANALAMWGSVVLGILVVIFGFLVTFFGGQKQQTSTK
ncbi:MAG: hypothetical protein D9V47_06685 [Clostridia bacterium]|nr:MAG: hypothetical protein D9V47_06685 [Clostridia bacterium]